MKIKVYFSQRNELADTSTEYLRTIELPFVPQPESIFVDEIENKSYRIKKIILSESNIAITLGILDEESYMLYSNLLS